MRSRRTAKPKVLVLRHDARLGGMGRAAEFFTPVVASSCDVVSVVTLSADRSGSVRVRAAWPARVSATAAALARCARVLALRAPGALYLPVAQWGLPLLRDAVIAVLAKTFRCTPVLHLHGSQLPARLRASAPLRRALAGGHWLVLSEAVAADLRASGCRAASVRVVRNPAPAAVAAPRTPHPAGRLRVGWLGTMHRSKGFDIVCEAVAALKRAGAPVSFSVAGMRSDVAADVMACVDEDFGVLAPDEVGAFWSGVDVFVLPARWAEGLPFVLLESLQAGCAVAATWSPGSAELFARGCVERIDGDVASVTGFLTRCLADAEGVRGPQQEAWRELRPLYDRDAVRDSFARTWQEAGL